MKLLFALALVLSVAAMAQNASITVISTGDIARNSVAVLNTNFANLNTAKVARFTGTGAPGSIPLNLPGDIYSDTTNGNLYWCAAPTGTLAPACTSVTTGGWTKANGGSPPAGCTTAVQRNGGSGAFGGDCNFTYDGTTVSAAVPLSVIVPATGPTGTSTTTNKTAGLGLTRIFVDPNATNDSGRNNIVANNTTVFTSGLNQPGNYANVRASNLFFEDFNGNNSPDNSDKKTKLGRNEYIIFRGSGQKFGHSINVTCPAAGDCGGVDIEVQNGGHPTAFGDEGGLGLSVRNWQPDQVQGTLTTPPVTTSACNTTTTGSIAKSQGAVSPVTVGVVSTSGCSAGDLVTFDQGAFGVSDFNKEVVKITAVTGGGSPTITALFQYNHAGPASVSAGTNAANAVLTTTVLGLYPGLTVALTGESTTGWDGTYTVANWPTVTDYGTYAGTVAISLNSSSLGAFSGTATLTPTVNVQPAPYVAVDNMDFGTTFPDPGGYGQDRLAILNPGSPVTTAGHITSTCNDQNQAQCTFAGDSSTDWTSHGIGNQGFCIRPDIDQYSFQGGSTRSYYWPINGVTDAHHLTVYHYNGQAISGTYTYQIVTCGQIAYHDLTATPSALTVRGIALYYNPNAWTSGSTFLQPMNQWSTVVHNVFSMGEYSGPQGYHPTSRVQQLGSLFRALNSGQSTFQNAFFADKGYNTDNNTGSADYQTAFNSVGVTQYGAFSATGKDLSGIAVAMQPYSGDPKCLRWNASAGYENSQACAGLSGNGVSIQSDSHIVNLGDPDPSHTTSGKLDYSALGPAGTATWKLPATSGTIWVPPGASSTNRTLPSNTTDTVDIGTVTSGYNEALTLYVVGGATGSAGAVAIYNLPVGNGAQATYAIVKPISVSGTPGWQLEAAGDTSLILRLRSTAGAGGQVYVTLLAPVGWPTLSFAESSTVGTNAAPTAVWGGTALTQTANTVQIWNATGFAATLDPTALTAPRTITYDDASGHQMLANNAGTYTITGGSTVAFGTGGTVVYAVSPPSIGATFTNAGSTLVAGANTYYVRPSTGQGGTTCTIQGYNIWVDTGTASFDVWKIAAGTALPTVSNTIISGASYLAISTGTLLESTTTSALTTTTVSGGDVIGFHLQTVTGSPTVAHVELPCKQ